MNKELKIILLGLGICPFVIPVILGLYNMATGSLPLLDTLVMYSFLYWPTYLIGLGMIILAVIKMKKK